MRETVFLHLCVLVTALNSNFMFLLELNIVKWKSWFQREMVFWGGGGGKQVRTGIFLQELSGAENNSSAFVEAFSNFCLL